jgi:dTDP-glucose pyrophosphorylase
MDQSRFEQIFISPGATIRQAIESIDAGAIEIALLVDGERRLIGTITDGDVRRALLSGAGLDATIDEIVHRDPVTAPEGTDAETLLALMKTSGIDQVPLLSDGRVVDVAFIRDLVGAHSEVDAGSDNPVVLMAGGRGTRLYPLTEQTPKPMLPVGDRPLLEHVIGQVRDAGFSRVLIAVNYRAESIEEHFQDGSRYGVRIDYLRENEPLGSAGALRLAGAELDRPFVVMNADLVTNVNLAALMRFHRQEGNALTVGVRQYALELPYGVAELADTRIVSLNEKPTHTFFVNAGIYAVDPHVMELMAERGDERFDMTDVIAAALAAELRVGGFPIREYWIDIGQLADYQRAESDHVTVFSAGR